MRVGASLRTSFVVYDVRQAAGWLVERARAAWEADLDSLFVGDEHVIGAPYYQNSPLLGDCWPSGDRPFVALLPPAPLEPGTRLPSRSHAGVPRARRFILPCAIGGGDQQFAGMGVDHSRRRPLRGRSGHHPPPPRRRDRDRRRPYRLHEAIVSPVPPEPVEVWIGGTAERAVDGAARLGDGFLSDAP